MSLYSGVRVHFDDDACRGLDILFGRKKKSLFWL